MDKKQKAKTKRRQWKNMTRMDLYSLIIWLKRINNYVNWVKFNKNMLHAIHLTSLNVYPIVLWLIIYCYYYYSSSLVLNFYSNSSLGASPISFPRFYQHLIYNISSVCSSSVKTGNCEIWGSNLLAENLLAFNEEKNIDTDISFSHSIILAYC